MIEELLKGAFIYAIGINSEQLVIDFANNTLDTTYRLWIDTLIDCELKRAYENRGLEEDEVELLAINRLKYLAITEVQLSRNDDLQITFEKNLHLKVPGSNPDKSCYEPWRFYQLSPEDKTLKIVSNK
ncbi:MAG TPA: hypothetical protein VNS32_15550 [Flavisolibacter sp.]|nr:hypothetical protein [Flavisolibacter sp.]